MVPKRKETLFAIINQTGGLAIHLPQNDSPYITTNRHFNQSSLAETDSPIILKRDSQANCQSEKRNSVSNFPVTWRFFGLARPVVAAGIAAVRPPQKPNMTHCRGVLRSTRQRGKQSVTLA